MKITILLGAALAMVATTPAGAEEPPAPEGVQVMVLGTWHFDKPGLDLHNARSDDVLQPRRQAELDAVAAAIAAFRPTKVMIERVVAAPDLVDPSYTAFTQAALAAQRDERVQVGYRIAHRLGLRQVYGIDEQSSEGEPDYFPFGPIAAFAQAHGMQDRLDALMAQGGEAVQDFEARQQRLTIAELLAMHNDPSGFQSGIGAYYELLRFGDTQQQPGADLNAMWYLRNAKIFAKLMQVAQPGDRVLVVYGAGHNYWLRHFASQTRGFSNVDPRPYLQAAGE